MIFSEPDEAAVAIDDIVIYKQISLYCKNPYVTKVPILKKIAGITLAILDAARRIKFRKTDFQQLAHHVANLIVGIWPSDKNAKDFETCLPPLLRQGLLDILNSILAFVEEEASTNVFIRMVSGPLDTRRIIGYRERLMITLDKFQIQSKISANRLLLDVLENQTQLSNQIQHNNEVKRVPKRVVDNGSRTKTDKGASERKPARVSSTPLRVKKVAGSNKARTKKTVQKNTRKASINSEVDDESDDESESDEDEDSDEDSDEEMPSIFKTRSPMHNFILPLPAMGDRPWAIDQSYGAAAAAWALPSCSSVIFSSKGLTINCRRNGNIPYSNFSHVRNNRSMHYHS